MKSLHIFIIAGEPSGDALGAKLIKKIREITNRDITFSGVGGERMKQQGFASLFPMSELSLIGFAEIIPHIPHLLNRINQTVDAILKKPPDIVVTIDSPGFNFRVVKKLQGQSIKLLHYVAPTVWAYKPKRAKKVASLYDHLLLLLPFESSYFEEVNLPCTFVGHPILEEDLTDGDGEKFREKHHIPVNAPTLCIMPGSREGELKRLIPVFTETLEMLVEKFTDLHAVVIATPDLAEAIKQQTKSWPIKTVVISDLSEKKNAFAACNAALVKSGACSLEAAIAGLPMVIAYKVHPVSAWMLRRMIKVRYVSIINLILGKEIIPELLQEQCTAELLFNNIEALLEDEEVQQKQLSRIGEALSELGMGDDECPSEKAATKLLHEIPGW